jgi:hypothetical protein
MIITQFADSETTPIFYRSDNGPLRTLDLTQENIPEAFVRAIACYAGSQSADP